VCDVLFYCFFRRVYGTVSRGPAVPAVSDRKPDTKSNANLNPDPDQ